MNIQALNTNMIGFGVAKPGKISEGLPDDVRMILEATRRVHESEQTLIKHIRKRRTPKESGSLMFPLLARVNSDNYNYMASTFVKSSEEEGSKQEYILLITCEISPETHSNGFPKTVIAAQLGGEEPFKILRSGIYDIPRKDGSPLLSKMLKPKRTGDFKGDAPAIVKEAIRALAQQIRTRP